MAPKKEDPIERIGKMIDERISAADVAREQKDKEAKDPWARLEGMIDRAVGRRFEVFAKRLEDPDEASEAGTGKTKEKGDVDDDGGILKILGLG